MPQVTNEPYWMIEKQINGRAHWWMPDHSGRTHFNDPCRWTTDAHKAKRFESAGEARYVMGSDMPDCMATEHLDCDGPMPKKLSKREFLALPVEERRRRLAEQANDPELIAYYQGIEADQPTPSAASESPEMADDFTQKMQPWPFDRDSVCRSAGRSCKKGMIDVSFASAPGFPPPMRCKDCALIWQRQDERPLLDFARAIRATLGPTVTAEQVIALAKDGEAVRWIIENQCHAYDCDETGLVIVEEVCNGVVVNAWEAPTLAEAAAAAKAATK